MDSYGIHSFNRKMGGIQQTSPCLQTVNYLNSTSESKSDPVGCGSNPVTSSAAAKRGVECANATQGASSCNNACSCSYSSLRLSCSTSVCAYIDKSCVLALCYS